MNKGQLSKEEPVEINLIATLQQLYYCPIIMMTIRPYICPSSLQEI